MAKSNPTPKTPKVAVASAIVETLKPLPTLVAATKQEVASAVVAVTKATKEAKAKRADRDGCKDARTTIGARDSIHPTGKTNDARQGSLRYNILEAILSSARVIDACAKEVHGAPGTKHETLPYRVKLVDVGFAAGNGFITTNKPE